jgi:hypothetical protein
MNIQIEDKIVLRVLSRFAERSNVGIRKYNTTLERNDLTTLEWLTHAQEEAMDFVLYLERLKDEYENLKKYSVLIDEKEDYGLKSIILTDNPMCGVKGVVIKKSEE